MVKLGILNSRMKDFYDIWLLSRMFDFNGETLAGAVVKTFENRKTPILANPTVFDASFAEDGGKRVQWRGFVKKAKLETAPETFSETVAAVKTFLKPLAVSLAERQPFRKNWNAPGPWR